MQSFVMHDVDSLATASSGPTTCPHIAGGLFAPSLAQATSTPAAMTAANADAATALSDKLGASGAGTYVDGSGKMVVAVTNPASAERVRAAGAVAKIVKYSSAQLTAA